LIIYLPRSVTKEQSTKTWHFELNSTMENKGNVLLLRSFNY